jgi:hypothetical protein
MSIISPPDLSSRPLHLVVERAMRASPVELYWAWTEQFDRWFAEPGTVLMEPKVDTVFYMETHHGGFRAPYYGRFMRLDVERLVEMTWVSLGTKGTETVITVALSPEASGTRLTLTHAGFPDAESLKAHEEVWPALLAELDAQLT